MDVNLYISENYIYVDGEDGNSIAEFEISNNAKELEKEIVDLIEALGARIVSKEYIKPKQMKYVK